MQTNKTSLYNSQGEIVVVDDRRAIELAGIEIETSSNVLSYDGKTRSILPSTTDYVPQSPMKTMEQHFENLFANTAGYYDTLRAEAEKIATSFVSIQPSASFRLS